MTQAETIRDDGGPAFPTEPNTQPGFYKQHGMTLRDYFAGQALAGIIAKSPYKSGTLAEMKASGDLKARSAAAYAYADAMLEARK
jgi:hypothetical protein